VKKKKSRHEHFGAKRLKYSARQRRGVKENEWKTGKDPDSKKERRG